MKILVTGAQGFIGRNLATRLAREEKLEVIGFDLQNTEAELQAGLAQADLVFHLAGVNRPESVDEFTQGNVNFTEHVCETLAQAGRPVPVVLASSIQVERDNPYGRSKLQAEEVVKRYAQDNRAPGIIYRLKNAFGKWCRPNYNSVVATFCHNIAHDLPISISDPNNALELVHIDDIVEHFFRETQTQESAGIYYREVTPTFKITLGRLAELLHSFREMRQSLYLPNLDDLFTRKLYGTYLSYLDTDDFAYDLQQRCDPRGCLAEFVKSPGAGQIFVSTTKPGITRGNHYHHTKAEKFLVLQGEAIVRFRHIENDQILEYPVRGEEFRVIDIPTGYTHSIENVGSIDLVTLFWSSEIFDPDSPDTRWLPVLPEKDPA
ncbi:MAG TPA: NAD-dependent epimerase/dehydratase family protein [Anaerolineae bacterium]|nr:NAD-dependent epimerase/dehydratase family protein [Anaerolineae bacterium]